MSSTSRKKKHSVERTLQHLDENEWWWLRTLWRKSLVFGLRVRCRSAIVLLMGTCGSVFSSSCCATNRVRTFFIHMVVRKTVRSRSSVSVLTLPCSYLQYYSIFSAAEIKFKFHLYPFSSSSSASVDAWSIRTHTKFLCGAHLGHRGWTLKESFCVITQGLRRLKT